MIWTRPTQARRMIRITFDFRGPSFMTLDEQTDRITGKAHGGRKKERASRRNTAWRVGIGHNLFGRCGLERKSAQSTQCQRSRHDRQESATAEVILPELGLLREFQFQEFVESISL